MTKPHEYILPDGRKWVINDGLLYGADAEVALWVNDRLGGGGLVELMFIGIGILKPNLPAQDVHKDKILDQLIGGVYFFNERIGDDYSDIYAAVSVDDIIAGHPSIIRRILNFPFGLRNHRRISLEIDITNERAIRNAEDIGFKLEGIKRGAAPRGGDIALYGLMFNESRFWTPEAKAVA